MSTTRRRSILILIIMVVALATTLLVIQAQLKLQISPAVDSGLTDRYDEAALTLRALNEAASMFGFQGETISTETYLITLGQWYSLNHIESVLPEGQTRQSPVFVVKASGSYPMEGPDKPPHDRMVVALMADTGQFVGARVYPPGVDDLTIDLFREDVGGEYVPVPQSPREDDEEELGDKLPVPSPANP